MKRISKGSSKISHINFRIRRMRCHGVLARVGVVGVATVLNTENGEVDTKKKNYKQNFRKALN